MASRFAFAILSAGLLGLAMTANAAPDAKEIAATKAGLQELQEYIGDWKGSAETATGKSEIWKESMSWGWNLKGDLPSLNVKLEGNKFFGPGKIEYDASKKKYKLTIAGADKKEVVFDGEIKRKFLTFSRTDTNGDKLILTLSTNNEGARLVYNYAVQPGGKGIEKKQFASQLGKEGASIAGGKKNECVVTGGLGTMAVAFGGKTYYVCCSGCRDAFNENPKKFVDEFEKKNKK